jgi:hypothetical protein
MKLLRPLIALHRNTVGVVLAGWEQMHAWSESCGRGLHALAVAILPALFLLRTTREEIYNILWALVFAFATLNILSLGAHHFEADRRGLSFGEILAIMVVVVSVILLGWEMLYIFKVFPLHLTPH